MSSNSSFLYSTASLSDLCSENIFSLYNQGFDLFPPTACCNSRQAPKSSQNLWIINLCLRVLQRFTLVLFEVQMFLIFMKSIFLLLLVRFYFYMADFKIYFGLPRVIRGPRNPSLSDIQDCSQQCLEDHVVQGIKPGSAVLSSLCLTPSAIFFIQLNQR